MPGSRAIATAGVAKETQGGDRHRAWSDRYAQPGSWDGTGSASSTPNPPMAATKRLGA